jgi:hypothetical protein
MKAEYFVVLFLVLCTGAYFTYQNRQPGRQQESNMVISSDNNYEKIAYSGKIEFNEDETLIHSISPKGYFHYIKNRKELDISSDAKANLSYELTADGTKEPFDSNGKKLVTEAIKEMIAWGVNADERISRIFRKAGIDGLINELPNLKSENLKRQYLEFAFRNDSIANTDLVRILNKVPVSFGTDEDKQQLLSKIKPVHLTDSAVANAYLLATASIDADYAKVNALKNILTLPLTKTSFPLLFKDISTLGSEEDKANMIKDIIEKGQMNEEWAGQIMDAIVKMGPDYLKKDLIARWINKGTLPPSQLDKLLAGINELGDDMEKQNLYQKLMRTSLKSGEQWVSLLNKASDIRDENQKTELLLQIAQKMPRTDSLKTVYLKVAKTIGADQDYGRAIRAVE